MTLAIIIYLMAALYVFMDYYMDPWHKYKLSACIFMGIIWLPYLVFGLFALAGLAIYKVFNK